MHRSEAYRLYKKAFGGAVLEQCVKRFQWKDERLAIGLICHPPNAHTFDIDNRVKPLLDCLTDAGVIPDDKFVDLIVIARGDVHAPHGAILVHIEECSASSSWQWLIGGRRDARAYSAANG